VGKKAVAGDVAGLTAGMATERAKNAKRGRDKRMAIPGNRFLRALRP
jgi:hypothetical protein